MDPGPELDRCLVEHHKEQISGLKNEVTEVSHNIVTTHEDNSGRADKRSAISKAIFSTHLQI